MDYSYEFPLYQGVQDHRFFPLISRKNQISVGKHRENQAVEHDYEKLQQQLCRDATF